MKLTYRQARWIRALAANADPMLDFRGRSERGGATRVKASLGRLGLIDNNGLTAEGRSAAESQQARKLGASPPRPPSPDDFETRYCLP